MSKLHHWQLCEAPICADTRGYGEMNWRKELTWFPDEAVCQKGPYAKWQKMQNRLRKFHLKGTLKHPELFYTVLMLEEKSKIRTGSKGINPNRKN